MEPKDILKLGYIIYPGSVKPKPDEGSSVKSRYRDSDVFASLISTIYPFGLPIEDTLFNH